MRWTELPIWRIAWLELAFFRLCRWLERRRYSAWLDWLFGFDFSKHQGVINFLKVWTYGAKFIILRCAYNITQDQKFAEYMLSAPQYFTALSVYHYYDPQYTPQAQAQAVIATLAPYKSKIKRVWLDLEFTWSGSYSAPQHWLAYRNAIEAAGYRTGIYTRATWWDSRVGTYAAEFGKRPLWAAQYNTSLTLIPKGWTKAMIWQTGTPSIGAQVGVSSAEVDYNKFNDEFDFTEEWAVLGPEPAPPIADGYNKLRRYDSDVHVVRTQFARAHVTNTGGQLQTVGGVAAAHGAQYAINGDGWIGAFTLSLAASDGYLYNPTQFDFRPFINFDRGNAVAIGHKLANVEPWNLVSGTRYLVENYANSYAASQDPEHVLEVHPRSAVGHTSDDKIVLCVVDGRSPESAGVTLKELAYILIEAGAQWAIELDGGGSSSLWVGDRIVNVPSDGAERAVINHLLLFTEGAPMSKYEAIAIADGTRLRPFHNTDNTYLSSHPKGTKFHGDVLFEAVATLYNANGTVIQKPGDTWLQVADVDGVAKAGWVAIDNMGLPICTLSETQPEKKVTEVSVQLASGSVVTTKYSDGTQKVETA